MHGERSFKQSLRVPRPEAVLTDEQLQNHFDAFDQLLKETGLPPIWNGKTLVAWKEYHKNSIEFASQCHGQLGVDQPQRQLKGTYAKPVWDPNSQSGGRLIYEHASVQGLYLQATGDPCCFSFVTYTPQTRKQMLNCGDLDASEEYFNPVIFDFLLFASEAALGAPAGNPFPITYDDVSIITSRQEAQAFSTNI